MRGAVVGANTSWYLEGFIDTVGLLCLLDMLREQGKMAASDALSKAAVGG